MFQEIHDLNDRARQLARRDLPQAIGLSQEAARLSQQAGAYGSPYTQGLAESWQQLGNFYLELAQFDEALSYFRQAQAQYEAMGGGEQLATLFSNIGMAYAFMSDYPSALQFELKFLEEAQRVGERELQATALNNVGYILIEIGDHAKALPYLAQGLAAFVELDDPGGQAMLLDSQAEAYLGLGEYEKALACGLEGVRLCRAGGDRLRESECLGTVGRIYAAQKDAERAEQSLLAALAVARDGGFRREEEMALRFLGGLYQQQKKMLQALDTLQEALRLAADLNVRRDEYECHEALAAIYRDMHEFEKALQHYEQFHALKENVFHVRNAIRLRELEMQHRLEIAQSEAEIYQLRNVELEREIIERKRAESALKELAITDGLTGLANRRHLLDLAHAALALSQRYTHPLSILLLDVDRFKSINDAHGHAVGDQVLVQFATRLKATVRTADIVGRYGGDEFVAILPETDVSQALHVARRVRAAITEMPIQVKDFGFYISTSIGIRSNEQDYSLALATLIEQADAALYIAKSGKRGPVVTYDASR